MATIDVPFREDMKQALLAGKKTKTSRGHRLGEEGDNFVIDGKTFIITKIEKLPLSEVSDSLFRDEGFDNPEAFVKVWNELHPRKKYSPTKNVFVHTLEESKGGSTQSHYA